MPEQDFTRKTASAAELMQKAAAEKAARDEALTVIERWNAALASGTGAPWSPTIRAAVIARMPWLDVPLSGLPDRPRN